MDSQLQHQLWPAFPAESRLASPQVTQTYFLKIPSPHCHTHTSIHIYIYTHIHLHTSCGSDSLENSNTANKDWFPRYLTPLSCTLCKIPIYFQICDWKSWSDIFKLIHQCAVLFFFNDDIELFLEDVIKEPEGIKADLSSRCLTIYTHGALVR